MAGLFSRVAASLKHSWNVFTDPEYYKGLHEGSGGSSYFGRSRGYGISSERSIISSIYTRLSIDVAGIDIRHTRHDSDGRYLNDMNSSLQDCLTVEPNLDQGPTQFRQDMAMTLFESGTLAVVPVETSVNPDISAGFNILSMRVGTVVGWHPQHVRVELYDERDGQRKQVTVPKSLTAIVENPLYTVMNEPSSTLKRLQRKLSMLDAVDEQSSSGKLDMIIQLPYVIKSEARRQQAEQRRKDIESQLAGTKYGIAYTDGTEKITQLNRPVENNLLEQVKYLTDKLYTELGLTPEVMNGTADEKAMLNYFNRTIKPIVQSITEAMKRSFLTKTARTQGQSIDYFRDPFALVPMEQLAEISDKFTRNEILTANEIRQGIGFKPSKDPKADKLINSNMPQPPEVSDPVEDGVDDPEGDAIQSGLDEANGLVDSIFAELGIQDE